MATRTVIFNYEVNGLAVNAYSVTLASSDGSYGIKDQFSGTVVVSNGTAVDNPTTGRYEYTTTDFDDTKVYEISWRIVPNDGDQPYYKVELVGPFTPNATQVRASSDYRGSFRQGTTATLMLKITNFDGIPQDASSVLISIKSSAGVLVETGTPEKATTGFYVYDWDISSSQTNGDYSAIWTYVVDGVTRIENQTIVVSTDATDTDIYSGMHYELRLALESYLSCAMSIPVYFEQAKPTADRQKYRFTFPRWNQTAGIKVYRNDKIVSDGVRVDFFKGEIQFDQRLTSFDVINADYNFRWFSDEDLNLYLINAIRVLNSNPPHSSYTMNNLADRYIPVVIKQASVDAIRHMMMCLQFQQPQQVFGGKEAASQAFGQLETLKENYEKEIQLIYENKKYGPYKGLTKAIVTPEFTLPGGRSRWFRYLFTSGS